jgi:quercetin dioxygenase-like cupin family protein
MEPRFLPPGASPSLTVLGIRHRILLGGERTGGAYALLKLSIPSGLGLPPHVHANEDEVFHVLEGAAAFAVGGERIDARAGATVVGPRGVPHAYTATSRDACRMIVVVSPAGFERFFREIPAAKRGDRDAVIALVGRYGITFPA